MSKSQRQQPRRTRRAAMRDLLKGKAFTLLSLLKIPVTRPIAVRAANELTAVQISVRPVDDVTHAIDGLPGMHFSPLERLIYDAVLAEKTRQPDRPITGKVVASRLGHEYNAKLKIVLGNLVERGVLTHAAGEDDGYSLPSAFLPRKNTA